MLDKIAHSGTETPDTPYIRLALAGMEEVRATVEAGIAGGAISPQQLFDTNYTPLAGDKPQQYMNGLVPFADRVLRPMLDRQTAVRPSIVGCCLLDANGFLHTHRSEEHTADIQSLMRIKKSIFCYKKKQEN